MYGKSCNLRTLIREYDCLANIGTKKAFTDVVTGKLGQRAACADSKQRQKYMMKKKPFVVDFGCNR